jgi:pyrimidine operon attenuation protein / uracil phosphoribosyltransferase
VPSAQRSPSATTAVNSRKSPDSTHSIDPSSHVSETSRAAGPTRVVLDAADISRALTRISHEILERNKGPENIICLGIPSRGVPLAARIAATMSTVEGVKIPAGSLDITMYRDDLRMRPARAIGATEIPSGGIDGAIVVIVDDVLFSGRTIRAALDALNDVGRPKAVQLAVLVDRGHRELPIRADFVGKNLPTSLSERVMVTLSEYDDPGGRDDTGDSTSDAVADSVADSVAIASPDGAVPSSEEGQA